MPAHTPLGPMVRMKEVRRIHGLTLNQTVERMAEQGVAISEAGLSNIENGNKQASERVLIAWAKAMGVEPLNVWHGPLREPIKAGLPGRVA